MNEEYESNAFSDKEPENNKQEPVDVPAEKTSAPVKVHKRSAFQQAIDNFVADDLKKVRDYIIWDVLIPAAKSALSNIIKTSTDMIIYGSTKEANRARGGSKPKYRDYYASDYPREDAPARKETRRGYSYDEVIFSSYEDAQDVYKILVDILGRYHWVRIADFYQACIEVLGDGIKLNATYTDSWWGWDERDFESVGTIPYQDGWVIRFPSPQNRR